MITLKPNGGLCNRLRAIDSGVLLSREINQPLRILWTRSPELNCSFHSLLHPPENTTVVDVKEKGRPFSRELGNMYFLFDYIAARIHYQRVIFQSEMNRLRKKSYDFTQLSKYESTYITCCNRFYRKERRYHPLEPVQIIRDVVNRVVESYSSYTVGVHVRRTDHYTVSPYSAMEGFVHAMNMQIEKNSDTTFYLATDSPDVISQLTAIFKDRIIARPKSYNRNSERGIQDALVDLLSLSKTQIIIGSRLSSFSETAAQLNDISAIYIKSGGEES